MNEVNVERSLVLFRCYVFRSYSGLQESEGKRFHRHEVSCVSADKAKIFSSTLSLDRWHRIRCTSIFGVMSPSWLSHMTTSRLFMKPFRVNTKKTSRTARALKVNEARLSVRLKCSKVYLCLFSGPALAAKSFNYFNGKWIKNSSLVLKIIIIIITTDFCVFKPNVSSTHHCSIPYYHATPPSSRFKLHEQAINGRWTRSRVGFPLFIRRMKIFRPTMDLQKS